MIAVETTDTTTGRKKIGLTIVRLARDFARVTEGTGPEDMQRISDRLREKHRGLERRSKESAATVADTFESSADFRRIYGEFNTLINSGRLE